MKEYGRISDFIRVCGNISDFIRVYGNISNFMDTNRRAYGIMGLLQMSRLPERGSL
jgi:hypothetical protein